MTVDLDALLTRRLDEEDVLLAVGTVRVRGLSRAEALRCAKLTDDQDEFEVQLLALAMVDPALTVEQVKRWRENALAGEIDEVVSAAASLSGLLPSDKKAAERSFRN